MEALGVLGEDFFLELPWRGLFTPMLVLGTSSLPLDLNGQVAFLFFLPLVLGVGFSIMLVTCSFLVTLATSMPPNGLERPPFYMWSFHDWSHSVIHDCNSFICYPIPLYHVQSQLSTILGDHSISSAVQCFLWWWTSSVSVLSNTVATCGYWALRMWLMWLRKWIFNIIWF